MNKGHLPTFGEKNFPEFLLFNLEWSGIAALSVFWTCAWMKHAFPSCFGLASAEYSSGFSSAVSLLLTLGWQNTLSGLGFNVAIKLSHGFLIQIQIVGDTIIKVVLSTSASTFY